MKKVLFKFIGVIGMVIGLSLITGYAQAQVDVNILGYSISPTNPQPNQAFSLSVTYNSCLWGDQTVWWVALSTDGTTLGNCPEAGQEFLVDVR